MTVLIAALIAKMLESLLYLGCWFKIQADKQDDLLMHGKPQPVRLPVIDNWLQTKSRGANKIQRKVAQAQVKSIRWMVNTRAFEHAMQAAVINASQRALKGKRRY